MQDDAGDVRALLLSPNKSECLRDMITRVLSRAKAVDLRPVRHQI